MKGIKTLRTSGFGVRVALLAAIGVLLVTPLSAYVTIRTLSPSQAIVQLKWPEGPITWRMNPTPGANVSGNRSLETVFQEAFGAWNAVPTASINLVQGPNSDAGQGVDGINVITTNAGPLQAGVVARAFSSFFSSTGEIAEVDIVFNANELFSTDAPGPDRFDLQSVAAHEIGHMLGLEHTTITSSTMNWTVAKGTTHSRVLSPDDIAGISTIYPNAGFAAKGAISGTVRTTSNAAVYGAVVTAVNASGQPVASAITNPQGQYTIQGLDAGAYTLFAEPLDQPVQIGNVGTLITIYPGSTVNTNFQTTFR